MLDSLRRGCRSAGQPEDDGSRPDMLLEISNKGGSGRGEGKGVVIGGVYRSIDVLGECGGKSELEIADCE